MANKVVAKNKAAFHNYTVIDRYEAGIVLCGTEIKSIREGRVNLKDSYVTIDKKGEVYVYSMHISPYSHGNIYNKDPLRPRKLLLNRREISKLIGEITKESYALIPLSLYFKKGLLKMELGVCKGKKLYDKREDMKKKEANLKMQRAMKNMY